MRRAISSSRRGCVSVFANDSAAKAAVSVSVSYQPSVKCACVYQQSAIHRYHHHHHYHRCATFSTATPLDRNEDNKNVSTNELNAAQITNSTTISPQIDSVVVDDSTNSSIVMDGGVVSSSESMDDIGGNQEIAMQTDIEQLEANICPVVFDTTADESSVVPKSIPSEAHVWRRWTDQVLNTDNNSTNQRQQTSLSHFALLIKWWARQRPFTDEAAIKTWKLFDMVDQWRVGQLSSSASSSLNNDRTMSDNLVVQSLINIVLDHWRLSAKTPSISVPYTAYEIWQRLQEQPPYLLTIRTYAIFVSAISRQNFDALPPHRKGPLSPLPLAIEVLQYYMTCRPTFYTTKSERESVLVLWNAILTVIAKQGRGPHVGEKAELMLREMQSDIASSHMVPDAISYACVLEAWVMAAKQNPSAGANAERLLQEMIKVCMDDTSSHSSELGDTTKLPTPDVDDRPSAMSLTHSVSICCLHVLRVYCNSDTPTGADQANEILQKVRSGYLVRIRKTEDDADDAASSDSSNIYRNVAPTRHMFSAVMAGYADRGRPTEVERLLFELQGLYESSGGDPLLFPTTATFNSVLDAFARQGTPMSAERAQQLLEQLYAKSLKADTSSSTSSFGQSNLISCLPDTTSVNTCLHAWAQSGAPNAVERAEELLRMTSQWPSVRPDPYSYTSVMKALANSNRPNAAERCEGILRHMWEQYAKEGKKSSLCKPNDVTYTTAIYSWSTASNNPDAPLRAEALYKDMRERYQNGDHTLKPTLQVYVALILAWAHSPRKEGDVRAQMYFDVMRGQYLAGDESVRPDDKVYRALIESKKRRNDGEGAEMTLNHMYDDYLTHGNTGAMPNRFIFHNVMSAWVNSTNPDSFQRIEAIVHRMQQEHKVRKWDCKPTAITYTILLGCLAKIGTKDSAVRAEKVLRHMYDLSATDESVKPCRFSCTTVMQAWANTVGVSEAPLRAQAIFNDMIRLSQPPRGDIDIRPSSFTFNSLLTAWARSPHTDAGERSFSILHEIERHHKADPKNFEAPNHYHYTAVMSAFANRGDVDNVEQVLQRMIDVRLQPHTATLNSVLKAYSRSTSPDAADRAEKFLRNMESAYSISPNYVSYTTLMLCIQRSQHPDSYRRCLAIVNEMIELSGAGTATTSSHRKMTHPTAAATVTSVSPNIVTFATLVVALRECMDPTIDKLHELDQVTRYMDQMNIESNTTIQKDMLKIRLSTTRPPTATATSLTNALQEQPARL